MEARLVFLICFLPAAAKPHKIKLDFDRPSLRVAVSQKASLECCYSCECKADVKWIKSVMISKNESVSINLTENQYGISYKNENNIQCSSIEIKDTVLNDTGLYWCALTESNRTVYTPGTFLQVYEPIQMVLGISERSKNSIITAEGVLLLFLLLLPGIVLICKSKGLNELEKRKGREDENIYEGLNLDECNSTYHKIQRSLVQGPYQDVISNDEDDIQLEKP